jgi:hypothetical protein
MLTHIKTLLVTLSCTLTLLVLVLSVTGYEMLSGANDVLDERVSPNVKTRDLMGDLRFRSSEIQQFITDSCATGEEDGMVDAKKSLAIALNDLDAIKERRPDLDSPLNTLREHFTRQMELGNTMVKAYRQSTEEGNKIMKAPNGFDTVSDEIKSSVHMLFSDLQKIRDSALSDIDTTLERSMRLMQILGIVIIAVVLLGFWQLYSRVYGILGGEPEAAVLLAQRMADGDMTHDA